MDFCDEVTDVVVAVVAGFTVSVFDPVELA
jgi:hypothetical protein